MLLEERLKEALWDLSQEEKVAVHCRFWEQMSILEISNFLNCSWSKADQILDQALKQLREELRYYPDCSLEKKIA